MMTTADNEKSIKIIATGSYIPEKKVTNDDLSQIVDTCDEWIRTRTGIESRHIANELETTSFMGTQAAKTALNKSGLKKEDIDLLIVATSTSEMPFPGTAASIQKNLELKLIPAFDIPMACSGFIYALEVGTYMLQAGHYRNALIVGVDKMSGLLDWSDRSTCVLFADGAGAAIISKTQSQGLKITNTRLCTDGAQGHILKVAAKSPKEKPHIQMNGKELFKWAIKTLTSVIQKTLLDNSLTIEKLDWIIPHQANIRMIEAIAEHLGAPLGRFICNVSKYGNTSAASIPIALNEAWEDGRIKSGQKILLVGFGAGLSWGTCLLE